MNFGITVTRLADAFFRYRVVFNVKIFLLEYLQVMKLWLVCSYFTVSAFCYLVYASFVPFGTSLSGVTKTTAPSSL